jgi:hypothetical protein
LFACAEEFPLVGVVVLVLESNECRFGRPRNRGEAGAVNGFWLWWGSRIGVLGRRWWKSR